MSSNIMLGFNANNNDYEPIKLTNDNKLQVDASFDTLNLATEATLLTLNNTLVNDIKTGQTEIKNLLNTMQPDLNSLAIYQSTEVVKRLRRLRSYGHCYAAQAQGVTPTSSGIYHTALLTNPSSNTKSMYVYNINYSINFDSANGIVLARLFSCPQSNVLNFGNAAGTIVNMRVDSTVPSDALFNVAGGTSIDISPAPTIMEVMRVVDRGEGTFHQLDFQEEYIQIPPGFCIGLSFNSLASVPIHWTFNIRFAMTDSLLDV